MASSRKVCDLIQDEWEDDSGIYEAAPACSSSSSSSHHRRMGEATHKGSSSSSSKDVSAWDVEYYDYNSMTSTEAADDEDLFGPDPYDQLIQQRISSMQKAIEATSLPNNEQTKLIDGLHELRRHHQQAVDEMKSIAFTSFEMTKDQLQREKNTLFDEFSSARLELEAARDRMSAEQLDELSRVRIEEMIKREEEVEAETARMKAEMTEKLSSGALLLPFEAEALQLHRPSYFPLYATKGHDVSPAAMHFRLAESQYYRLAQAVNKVNKVDYVVNPLLHTMFHQRKLDVAEAHRTPILAFHTCEAADIVSICEDGFRDSTHALYQPAALGRRGVQFSLNSTTPPKTNAAAAGAVVANPHAFGFPYAGYPGYPGHPAAQAPQPALLLLALLLVLPEDYSDEGVIVIDDSSRCLPTYILHCGVAMATEYSQDTVSSRPVFKDGLKTINPVNPQGIMFGLGGYAPQAKAAAPTLVDMDTDGGRQLTVREAEEEWMDAVAQLHAMLGTPAKRGRDEDDDEEVVEVVQGSATKRKKA